MLIIEPIEKQHRRVTQGFGENFQWKGKPMYGKGGHIPAWQYHLGIDYTSRENQWGNVKPLPIRAGVNGYAKMIEHTGKGNLVTIEGVEYFCEYMHLDSFEGGSREVEAGEIIGYTGNTGTYSTAAHLHMGVRKVIKGEQDKTGSDYGFFDFTDLLIDFIEDKRDFSQIKIWRGCKVRRVAHIKRSDGTIAENASAGYNKEKDVIVLTPKFDTFDIDHQEGVLNHETGHRLWEKKFTEADKKAWEEISKCTLKVKIKLLLKGKGWMKNTYVNNYAKSKITEDFGETIEDMTRFPDKIHGNYEDIKRSVAIKLFEKYL